MAARATQQVIEALIPAGAAAGRVTHLVVEALVWAIDPWTGKNFDGVGGMPGTFPTLPGLAYSVIKRPKFFTGTGVSASGREVRVGYAGTPLWEWDLTFDYLPDKQTVSSATPSDLKQLLGFFLAQNGALFGFNFRDPDDNYVTGQPIGTGDGVQTNFLLTRTFGGTDGSGTEPIGAVDMGQPFHAYIDGVLQDPSAYDVVGTQPVGQFIRFHTAPTGTVTVDMGYFYFVHFKDDTYDFEKFMDKLWSQRMVTLASQRG
jgi:uncharacterized protein (TIGR02217 family)